MVNYGITIYSPPPKQTRITCLPDTTQNIRFGRDNFQESIKISSRVYQAEVDWTKFKFMVFDVPTERGTYDERFGILGKTPCNHFPSLEFSD